MDAISNIFWSVSIIINVVVILIVIQIVLLICCCCRRKEALKKDIHTIMRNHDLLDDKSDDRDNDEPEQYIDDSRKKRRHQFLKRREITLGKSLRPPFPMTTDKVNYHANGAKDEDIEDGGKLHCKEGKGHHANEGKR